MRTVAHWDYVSLTIIPFGLNVLFGRKNYPASPSQANLASTSPRTRRVGQEKKQWPFISIRKLELRSKVLCRIGAPVSDGAKELVAKVEQLRAKAEMTHIIAESLILTAWLEIVNTVSETNEARKWRRWHFQIMLLVNELTTRQMTKTTLIKGLLSPKKFSLLIDESVY